MSELDLIRIGDDKPRRWRAIAGKLTYEVAERAHDAAHPGWFDITRDGAFVAQAPHLFIVMDRIREDAAQREAV